MVQSGVLLDVNTIGTYLGAYILVSFWDAQFEHLWANSRPGALNRHYHDQNQKQQVS